MSNQRPRCTTETVLRSYLTPVMGADRAVIALLKPLFRYSFEPDAYVRRVVGRRFGPVLKRRVRHAAKPRLPA